MNSLVLSINMLKKLLLTFCFSCAVYAEDKPNILLITADDLNCSSVGVYGGLVKDTTPHIDKLAKAGVRFDYGHVTIAVCQPSRSVWMTGRYPHKSGGEGFFRLKKAGVEILPDILRKQGGYHVGILGKLGHSTPYKEFKWDMQLDMPDLGMGRSPKIYSEKAKEFMQKALAAKKPFFLMANSHDPHRPFHGNDPEKWYGTTGRKSGAMLPSKIYKSEEVTVPGFLPDIPEVRLEIAEYFSSVRRCDDTVGSLLKALEETGAAENTMVIFLSDNGMALPFAKTNCYLHSTRTPYIVRWPKRVKPAVDKKHMVSGIDITPSILDAAGLKVPKETDGKSFLPLLLGEQQEGRDYVYTQFYETSARRKFPMRAVQNRTTGYIYNGWADGEKVFKNESQFGRTWKAMVEAAKVDPKVKERTELFSKRVAEEFFDFQKDPDGLNNLINDPAYVDQVKAMRVKLLDWMKEHKDPELEAYQTKVK